MLDCEIIKKLAIIIPVGPKDRAWKSLLADLKKLPEDIEVLFVGPNPANLSTCVNMRWIESIADRGTQLNLGARNTDREFLWFLHADSRFSETAFEALILGIKKDPNCLHFFNLRFQQGSSKLMQINTVGVWFRSNSLKMPFGDQGFCIHRDLFNKIGGYPENQKYGEDHLFVWRARQKKIKLRSTQATIQTSARKYQDRGWFRTTSKYFLLTYKQALPEFLKLIKKRSGL